MTIELKINGRPRRLEIEPGDMLVDVLREAGYVEVKKGCDTGSCGVCTVLMNDTPIPSCSTLAAKADGQEIITVKGIEKEAAEFADFLTAEGADQCGFCAPGFALSVHSLVKENPSPNEEEIRHYLAGNLCRCSGYEGQLRAITKFVEANNE
ncbi:MAG: (2Fe-2S)-binding protein [Spirochaetia bacterium]|nr:(2Fe-2S)-binding protein [Spirochaetia bacterium]